MSAEEGASVQQNKSVQPEGVHPGDGRDSPSTQPGWWQGEPTDREIKLVYKLLWVYGKAMNYHFSPNNPPTRSRMVYSVSYMGDDRCPLHNPTSHFNLLAQVILSGDGQFADILIRGTDALQAQQQIAPRQYRQGDQRQDRGQAQRPQRGAPQPRGDHAQGSGWSRGGYRGDQRPRDDHTHGRQPPRQPRSPQQQDAHHDDAGEQRPPRQPQRDGRPQQGRCFKRPESPVAAAAATPDEPAAAASQESVRAPPPRREVYGHRFRDDHRAPQAAADPAISPTLERAIDATELQETVHLRPQAAFCAMTTQRVTSAPREVHDQPSGPPRRALPVGRPVAAPAIVATTQSSDVEQLVNWVIDHPHESISLDVLPASNPTLASRLIRRLAQSGIDEKVALANFYAAQEQHCE